MFQLTEKQEQLQGKIRSFAESEILPIAFQLDQCSEFPHEAMHKLARLGYWGIPYPSTYSGAGFDILSTALAVEELSRVDGGAGVILSAHISLGSYPIYQFGNEAQKQKYLAPMARGEKLGAFALTEPNAGSDAAATETTAFLDGDHYVLNGNKLFITNAPIAETYVVIAVTTPDIGSKGISAFIVEKGWAGFSFGDEYDKMGIRSSVTAELVFTDVRVPKENLLGKEGDGFKIAMNTLDNGRIGIAAQALGIAQGAYENALNFSKERDQFRKPLCHQQHIAFKLADMATKLRAARLMVYSAAQLKDEHEPHSLEASMAKHFASETCLEVVNDAIQIFGGGGYLKGMDVERAYRDARITTLYEGTSEVQKLIISAHILGNMGKERMASRKTQKLSETGTRKTELLPGSPQEQVNTLVERLVADGYDFTVGIPADTPIITAERVVCMGKGIGGKENLPLLDELAKMSGSAVGCTRPVAETLGYLPLNRYVGMSGQKFVGNLFIAVGVSGASQHLKGIKDATTIVAINNNKNARIFKHCDYGIVGDVEEVLPLLSKALDGGVPKKSAPPMVKMKKSPPKISPRTYAVYVCCGCGYEYDKEKGDPHNEVPPGTNFERLPDEWVCPECETSSFSFLEI